MTNIYRLQFVSHCPNNREPLIYALENETDAMVHVEHIATAARVNECSFHDPSLRWLARDKQTLD
ncbi:hypothetical protein [Paraburkholderia sp. J7]|uniref:hypothetical protein n=1 Tax=Paraburkholderia sp. J7 TaxID=2805438 RepID=UPI002AB77D71|nr:hypothetical protein [Paraburkholderia sp. J7]